MGFQSSYSILEFIDFHSTPKPLSTPLIVPSTPRGGYQPLWLPLKSWKDYGGTLWLLVAEVAIVLVLVIYGGGRCCYLEKGQQGLKQPCGQYSRGDEPAGRHRHAGALSLIDYRDSCPVEAMNEPTRESGSLQFNELKNPFGATIPYACVENSLGLSLKIRNCYRNRRRVVVTRNRGDTVTFEPAYHTAVVSSWHLWSVTCACSLRIPIAQGVQHVVTVVTCSLSDGDVVCSTSGRQGGLVPRRIQRSPTPQAMTSNSSSHTLVVDVLIGPDYYFDFVSGRICKGKSGDSVVMKTPADCDPLGQRIKATAHTRKACGDVIERRERGTERSDLLNAMGRNTTEPEADSPAPVGGSLHS
ncbi:hypothetical protein T4D_6813 [Trichinella pseudospiralis]|uniref:Uncharacterized protein n=1 Tax=Trichinella pseudospiralis TaxID=6337 RepID=A0A0V1FRR7_TRIPS|nr:hypothetical protein T4D_6813 [Trichinella pseudospiralis]